MSQNCESPETIVHYKISSFLKQPIDILQITLESIDAEFSAMRTLGQVVVRFHGEGASPAVIERMLELGWTVISGDNV
jgi:hypothetical protein